MTAIIYAETAAGWFDKDRLTIKRSHAARIDAALRRELLYLSLSTRLPPSVTRRDPSLNRWEDKSDVGRD